MHPGSEDFTSSLCKYGTYAYTVMPFYLTVSPAPFQGYINSITQVLTDKGDIAKMDHVTVATTTLASNVEITHQLLDLLLEKNLHSKRKNALSSAS
jgi:hypothetical protein